MINKKDFIIKCKLNNEIVTIRVEDINYFIHATYDTWIDYCTETGNLGTCIKENLTIINIINLE